MNDGSLTTLSAERIVLASMMDSAEAVWITADVLPGMRMTDPRHEYLARVMHQLASDMLPTDPTTVASEVERQGKLNWIGGPAAVYGISGEASTWRSVGHYAEMVRAAVISAGIADAGKAIHALPSSEGVTPEGMVERARQLIDEAALERGMDALEDDNHELALVQAQIGTTSPGLPTPWASLTSRLGGLRPGQLLVIGARPSVGKSAIAMQFANELQRHGTVAYITLEMSREENRKRLIAQCAQIPLSMLVNGKRLPEWADRRITEWLPANPGQIQYFDRAGMNIHDIRSYVRALARKRPLSGVVVDYLQLIEPADRRQNRAQEVAEMSRQLKIMAGEFAIPVIALSQLNRGPESRADGTPNMADLRESGAIEQDADTIILLHRPDFDDPALDLIIEKHRQGATGRLRYDWQGDFVRAVDYGS